MGEELKLCPNPACGGNRADPAHSHGGQYSVICPDCYMLGPRHKTVDEAIAAWNALPRVLVWSTEPPKVAGHYWCRYKGEDKEAWSAAYIPAVTDWCGRDDENDRIEWAGPIPEPQEL